MYDAIVVGARVAGYHRDFITGLGINDAFLQAELLANALADAWS